MAQHQIDLNRVTDEAEAGHGNYVRNALNELSFQERIHALQKIQEVSGWHHSKRPGVPYITFSIWADRHGDKEGYASLELQRHVPRRPWFGLLESSDELYLDCLDLYNGNEA